MLVSNRLYSLCTVTRRKNPASVNWFSVLYTVPPATCIPVALISVVRLSAVTCRCRPSSKRQAIATRWRVGRNPAARNFDTIAATVARDAHSISWDVTFIDIAQTKCAVYRKLSILPWLTGVFRAFLKRFDAFVPHIKAGRLAVWLIRSYLPVS